MARPMNSQSVMWPDWIEPAPRDPRRIWPPTPPPPKRERVKRAELPVIILNPTKKELP